MVIIRFFRQLLNELGQDKIALHNAAFAYSAIFALGPLLLVVISVVGLAFGQEAVRGGLADQLSGAVGQRAADVIQSVVAGTQRTRSGIAGLVIGSVGLLLGASGLVNQLRSTFNHIFQAVPDPAAGLKQLILPRIKNIILLLLGCLLIIGMVVASGLVAGIGGQLEASLGVPPLLLELINIATSLLVITIILAAMYRGMPDVRLPWRTCLKAGAIIGLLFVLGKTLLAWVIARNAAGNAYGAAASLISLLLWFYYLGQIIFTGAEGIKIHAKSHALVFPPKKHHLKRKTLETRLKSSRLERIIDSFTRGFDKKRKN